MEAVAAHHLPERQRRVVGHHAGAEALGVELDHEEQRQVIETGRDGRHPDHVEIADLEELGDQEGGGAEHRRRQDRAEPARRQQPAGGVLLEAGARHHRIGDGADRHRGGDARSRRAAQQERGEHHRAAGAVRLAAHQRHGKIDEEFSGAGMLQEGAVDGEHDDQARRHVDRDAEDAFERDEEMADEAREVVAAVGPGRRQMGTEQRIGDEKEGDDRHDPARGAPRRLQQQHDEDHAERDVGAVGRRGAVGEVLAAQERIAEDPDRGRRRDHVPHADAVTEPGRERKEQEAQHHHEGDVGVAQRLGRDDVVGGVEMEQAHRDRDRGDDRAGPAGEPVDHALFGRDEFFGLAQLRLGNSSDVGRLAGPQPLGHHPLVVTFLYRSRRTLAGIAVRRTASLRSP